MCRHILNAQVSVRAACCRAWFDCPQCHEETTDHSLRKTDEIIMACKKCKKVFKKDVRRMVDETDEADEYCPFCDNHYVIPAETPETRAIDKRASRPGLESVHSEGHDNEKALRSQREGPLPTYADTISHSSNVSQLPQSEKSAPSASQQQVPAKRKVQKGWIIGGIIGGLVVAGIMTAAFLIKRKMDATNDRLLGAFIGGFIGDAYGLQCALAGYDINSLNLPKVYHATGGMQTTQVGKWSSAAGSMLCIADSLLKEGDRRHKTVVQMQNYISQHETGYQSPFDRVPVKGDRWKKLTKSFKDLDQSAHALNFLAPLDKKSEGNRAVIRLPPNVLFACSVKEAGELCNISACVTHNTLKANGISALLGDLIYELAHGNVVGKKELFGQLQSYKDKVSDYDLKALYNDVTTVRDHDEYKNGTQAITIAVCSLLALKSSDSFIDGCKELYKYLVEKDPNNISYLPAAFQLFGSLWGAMNGLSSFPESLVSGLYKVKELEEIAHALIERSTAKYPHLVKDGRLIDLAAKESLV